MNISPNRQDGPRLLIFHPALPPYRLNLFNALSEHCRMRCVFLRENLLNQQFEQAQLRSRLKTEHGFLDCGFTFMKRTFRLGIWREIRRFQPEVVVTPEFSPTTLAVAIKRRLGGGNFAHVVWTDDNPAYVTGEGKIRGLVRHLMIPAVDGLIVLSNEAATLYREQYGTAAPIGISLILHEEADFRNSLEKAVNTAQSIAVVHNLEGRRVLLYVGRLAPEKRLDRLIKAFADFHNSMPNTILVLVGDGPVRDELQNLVCTLGVEEQVIFTGRLEGGALYAWYLVGSVFGLTSESEPFGAVVNEALLAGLPVICSHRAGARVLVQNGVNGVIVDASNPAALRDGLHDWLLKVEPIDLSSLGRLRASRMTVTFQMAVGGFISLIETVI